MTAAEHGEALERWFRDHGGYLHPSISVAYDSTAGYHVRYHSTLILNLF
jgi:hypothetical protein